jgi:peptide chain release factor 1
MLVEKDLIPPGDIQIEIWPPRQQGGQIVGSSSGIKLTHIPTGIMVIVNTERSQHINKIIAMDGLLSILTHPKFRG